MVEAHYTLINYPHVWLVSRQFTGDEEIVPRLQIRPSSLSQLRSASRADAEALEWAALEGAICGTWMGPKMGVPPVIIHL